MLEIIIYSAVAGIIGTGIGGLIGVYLKEKSKRLTSLVLSFAGGVMLSISCFNLMLIICASIIFGVVVVWFLNYVVDKLTSKKQKIETHDSLEELHHQEDFLNKEEKSKKQLLKAGIIMLFAISFHNFPEGMAIGASGASNMNLGLIMAILIALHNIPEGISIALPLIIGGVKKRIVLVLTLIAGACTLLGGIFGLLIGGISPMVNALAIGTAAGAMIYVTFGEIIPQSILMEKGRLPAVFVVAGIIAGLLLSNLI